MTVQPGLRTVDLEGIFFSFTAFSSVLQFKWLKWIFRIDVGAPNPSQTGACPRTTWKACWSTDHVTYFFWDKPSLRISELVGLGWDPGVCIYNKFPVMAMLPVLGTRCENICSSAFLPPSLCSFLCRQGLARAPVPRAACAVNIHLRKGILENTTPTTPPPVSTQSNFKSLLLIG